ncbi:MAG: T9SS type A sorting domain-containing protein [Bacteroidetes bacterium]|nr:T9SS type A sorting domain-containing protein [Bacteroidota bacterium]
MKKILLLLFYYFFFLITILKAQNAIPISERVEKIFGNKTEIQFKFIITSKTEINKLTKIISIDNVNGNEVFAYANKKEFAKFSQLGYSYEIINTEDNRTDIKMLDNINSKAIQAWDFYPTYNAYDSLMTRFQTNYPNLCRTFSIKTLTSERKLLFVKISKNPDSTENEPKFLYTSSMHGDEVTGYILMLRLIDYLLSNYGTDARITNIINNMEIWINPSANPDGTYAGGNNTVAGATYNNGNNVNLNRNYPDPQDGNHPDGEAWQPETMAFMALADSIQFTMSANFHGGSEVVNYPWDTWDTLSHKHADQNWWNYISREYADTAHVNSYSGYFTGPVTNGNGVTNGYAWYSVAGGRQDYMNYFKHCREVTMEISNIKTPPAATLPNYWNYNYRSMLNYMEQCMYGIKGIVTDSITGAPLKAKVFIQGHDVDSSHVYSILPLGNYFRPIYAGSYNVTYSSPGYYSKTVNVTALNKASVVKNIQLVSIGSSIQNLENTTEFSLFPNPTKNNIEIRFFNQFIENTTLIITDINGKALYNSNIHINNKGITINLEGFSKGIYFVKLLNDREINTVKKLIIN